MKGMKSGPGLQAHAPTDRKTLTSLDKPASASKASQTSEIESTGGALSAVDGSSQTASPTLTAGDDQRGGDPDAEASEAL